jgi:hypothetical protein
VGPGKNGYRDPANGEPLLPLTPLPGSKTGISPLLDLLFKPEATLQGRVKPAGPPWTYWNRLRLKRKLKKTMKVPVTRERILQPCFLEPNKSLSLRERSLS